MSTHTLPDPFTRRLLLISCRHRLGEILPLRYLLPPDHDPTPFGSQSELTDDALNELEKLGVDRAAIATAVAADVKELIRLGRAVTAAMPTTRDLLDRTLVDVEAEITAMPSGLQKAEAWLRAWVRAQTWGSEVATYEVMAALKGEVADADIRDVLRQWKSAAAEPRLLGTSFFWSSRLERGVTDMLAHYRFARAFGIGDFEPVWREVEGDARSMLDDSYAGTGHLGWLDINLLQLAFNLWLVARDPSLTRRLSGAVEAACDRLANSQRADGSWPDRTEPVGNAADSTSPAAYLRLTALAGDALARTGSTSPHRRASQLAVDFLLRTQGSDGSWVAEARPSTADGDTLTTVAALSCIQRARPAQVHSLELGMEWLRRKQSPLGNWAGNPLLTDTQVTLAVVDLEQRVAQPPIELNHYLRFAPMLLRSCGPIVDRDDEVSTSLAVIGAYQALESFLYGLLTGPHFSQSVFGKDPNRTIGFRAALTAIEGCLRTRGSHSTTWTVPERPRLERLADVRDQVVHKAMPVAPSDAREHLTLAEAFVSRLSAEVLGTDLLR